MNGCGGDDNGRAGGGEAATTALTVAFRGLRRCKLWNFLITQGLCTLIV